MQSISNNAPHSIEMEWLVSNVCNYKCSYCIPELNSGTHKFPKIDNALRFFNSLCENYPVETKLLNLSGGEPTLWPSLIDFIKNLPKSYLVNITTNGSASLSWWEAFFKKTSRLYGVTISVHWEYAQLDHILNVIERIEDQVRTTILILYNKDSLEVIENFIKEIMSRQSRVAILIQPIRYHGVENKSIEYNENDIQFIKSFVYNNIKIPRDPRVPSDFKIDKSSVSVSSVKLMIAEKKNQFKGWYCKAGARRLSIWSDGTVYPANCFTAKKNPLGNLNDGSIKTIDGLTCMDNYCSCLADIRIPKKSHSTYS